MSTKKIKFLSLLFASFITTNCSKCNQASHTNSPQNGYMFKATPLQASAHLGKDSGKALIKFQVVTSNSSAPKPGEVSFKVIKVLTQKGVLQGMNGKPLPVGKVLKTDKNRVYNCYYIPNTVAGEHPVTLHMALCDTRGKIVGKEQNITMKVKIDKGYSGSGGGVIRPISQGLKPFREAENTHSSFPLHDAVGEGNKETTKMLIDKGVNIDAKDDDEYTPLRIAVREENKEITKMLIDNGANVNAKDGEGNTPLSIGIEVGDTEIMKMLIEAKGANVNARDNEGNTLLHMAVKEVRGKIIKMLIDNRANFNAQDNEGNTPLSLAKKVGNKEIIKLVYELTH